VVGNIRRRWFIGWYCHALGLLRDRYLYECYRIGSPAGELRRGLCRLLPFRLLLWWAQCRYVACLRRRYWELPDVCFRRVEQIEALSDLYRWKQRRAH
jgi:hypothetical protein